MGRGSKVRGMGGFNNIKGILVQKWNLMDICSYWMHRNTVSRLYVRLCKKLIMKPKCWDVFVGKWVEWMKMSHVRWVKSGLFVEYI